MCREPCGNAAGARLAGARPESPGQALALNPRVPLERLAALPRLQLRIELHREPLSGPMPAGPLVEVELITHREARRLDFQERQSFRCD